MKGTIFCIALLLGILPACSQESKDKTTAGRKLVWSDEFDYTGLPNRAKWGYEEGFVRNQEPQYYTKNKTQNARVENGMLVIEAHRETVQNSAYVAGSTVPRQKDSLAFYTSASVNTLGKQTWLYGRIEVRAKLPAGKGSWPAIWMMGENRTTVGWPKCGEIDIMEFLGKDTATIYATVHAPDTTSAGHSSKGGTLKVSSATSGFHIYALEWDKDKLNFFYDNQLYFTYNISQSQHTGDNPFNKKCYLLLNLALGKTGSWPGPPDDNILPIKYYVDYVRVYQ